MGAITTSTNSRNSAEGRFGGVSAEFAVLKDSPRSVFEVIR